MKMSQIVDIKKAFEAMKNDNKSIPAPKKRGVPTKECPECDNKAHARASKCKCGYQFYIPKKKQQEIDASNWRDLKKGDIIKCIVGSGPYWLSKDKPGEKIMLGEKGRFEVVEIYDNGPKSCGIIGLQLHTRGRKANVREFIYMGESNYNEELCSYNEPHKILVLEKNE
jgi:hypothetical protein